MRERADALNTAATGEALNRYQDDWAARVSNNGKVTGVFTDYHYYGTGDIGGAPDEESVKRLEAIVTKGSGQPAARRTSCRASARRIPTGPPVQVGDGPVHVISANADQMFLDITPARGTPDCRAIPARWS